MENSKQISKKLRLGPVVIDREIFFSTPYLTLGRRSIQVLMIFLCKRKMSKIKIGKRQEWQITNNGKIVFTYREAEQKYEISRGAFSRAINELVKFGFIEITRPGIGYAKIETHYAISDRWKKYGTDEFKTEIRKPRINYKFPKKK